MLIVIKDKNEVSYLSKILEACGDKNEYSIRFKNNNDIVDSLETTKKTEIKAFCKKNELTSDNQTITIAITFGEKHKPMSSKTKSGDLSGGKKKRVCKKKTGCKK